MNIVSKRTRVGFVKTASILTAVTTVLSLSGIASFAPVAFGAAPSDYGLKEGDTISAAGSSDPDVYIVNDRGYKRLFLSPQIFKLYGHLGGFAKVKSVSPATRDAFPTSGLFRVDGDQKVYGLETTGEDVAVLHWVNTSGAQAVADDPDFFKKVFVINAAEKALYGAASDYTSVSQVPAYARGGSVAGTAPVAGTVNVSLASNNPGASTLTTKANGVTYMNLNLSGNGTVASVRVYRQGPGAAADFSNVYLYDGARRLTSGRTPSSADGSVTFSNLNLAISGSKVLSVVADMASAGATAGNVNYFALKSASDVVMSSGTVGGSFPLNGNNFTVSGQAGGTVTAANSGSMANPNVGQTHAQVAEFKLTTATEGAKISRVQLFNSGTVKASDINNLKIEVNGVQVATGYMTTNGYAVFDFGSTPYVIVKGDNRIFKVYADLNGKKSETITFYLEVTSDLLSVGDQFGFGMSVTNNFDSTSTNNQTLTLQGGVLTLSFVGPSAANISTNVTKVHFLDFDMNSAANVELKQHQIVLCKDTDGNGTFDAASNTTNGWDDITNIAIIDRDSGVTLVGPADGSTFTASDTSCPGGVAGARKQFTDTMNINAGQTLHLAVVGDVNTANTGSGVGLVSTDAVKVILNGYGDQAGTSGSLSVARYANTNTALASTDIVPSTDISGNTQTLQGSSLTLALAANPSTGNHNFVKGTQDVTANGFSFTTALGNPVTVTAVTLTGYVADSGTTLTKGVGAAPDANLNVSLLAPTVRLVDGDTGAIVASSPTSNNLSTSTGTAQFTSLKWVIPGGSTKTLLVKTDLSTNNTSGSSDVFSFDIAATTDVTAIDSNSNSINAGNAAVNGTTTPTTYTTVNSVGTLTPALAPDSQIASPVYWGQQSAPFSKFKFTSTNEGFYIERLNFYTADTAADLTNNVDNVVISYTDKSGSTMTSTATPNSAASVSFGFSGLNRPYVPKDGTMFVTVKANVKSGSSLFRAGNKNFSIDFSGGNADEFRAVGEGSGTVIDGATSTVVNVAGNNQYVYRAYPQFTLVSTPATNLFAGQDIGRFTVKAVGDEVFLDGGTAAASGSLAFSVTASGESTNSLTLELRRADNNQLLSTATALSNSGGTAASASFTINQNGGLDLIGGQSIDVFLRIAAISGFAKPTATGRAADYVQATMKTNVDAIQKWTDNSGTDRKGSVSSTANILPTLPVTFGTVQLK